MNKKFYIYNIFKKKFISKPFVSIIERFQGTLQDFPTFDSSIENAIEFTVENPIRSKSLGIGKMIGNTTLLQDSFQEISRNFSFEKITSSIDFFKKEINNNNKLLSNNKFVLHCNDCQDLPTEKFHRHLFVTALRLSDSYQNELEDGLVSKPHSFFFISNRVSPRSSDLYTAHHRDGGPIRAFLPFALRDESGNHVDFPLDPSTISMGQVEPHIFREPIEEYIFQWIFIPIELYDGRTCNLVHQREILEYKSSISRWVDSNGNAFFTSQEECNDFRKQNELLQPIGWQIHEDLNIVLKTCESVTSISQLPEIMLFKNVGDCFLENK
jgi:hypothetical protein